MSEKNIQPTVQETEPKNGETYFVERSNGRIQQMVVEDIEEQPQKSFGENNQPIMSRAYKMVGTSPEKMVDKNTGEEILARPQKWVLGSLLTPEAQLALEKELMDDFNSSELSTEEKQAESENPSPVTESTKRGLGKTAVPEFDPSSTVYHIPMQHTK